MTKSVSFLSLLILSCSGEKVTTVDDNSIDTAFDRFDADGDGYFNDEDCDDADASSHPNATEVCDGLDNNCDGFVDEGVLGEFYFDGDGDGFGDSNDWIEACQATEDYVPNGNDCDDDDVFTYPSAAERCDNVDNDCDGVTDEDVQLDWYLDEDGDGIGSDYQIEACDPPEEYVAETGDCDDDNPDAYPQAEEVCDEVDNDCDGDIDEDLTILAFVDADNDGFGDAASLVEVCTLEAGYILTGGDCDDIDSSIHPDADEMCDGQDNNCDGVTDEDNAIDAITWYLDSDGDGSGDPNQSTLACEPPTNYVEDNDDCNDTDETIFPNAPELCDGLINSCGGTLPSVEIDDDGDGYVECTIDNNGWDGTNINGDNDCNDGNNSIFPSATEIIGDEIDSDCDGGEICVLDNDDDGHGNGDGLTRVSVDSDCNDPFEATLSNTDDCDDSNALYNPTLGCFGTDCEDILNNGWGTTSGVYSIDPDGSGGNAPYDVYCDMQTDGGGWMRITHLHSNRSIGSIKRNAPFFSAAWQQNSTSFTNTNNANLVLDNNTYGMLDSTDFLQNANQIRLTCNDNTRNLNARAIWSPSSGQLNQWLAEGTDRNEYQSSPYTVSLTKNGGSFTNTNVYFSHTEDAFFGSWHVCGTLSSNTGGFQLGFCHNGPSSPDYTLGSDINQIMLGYHGGFSGLRLECTRDTPRPTSIIDGNLSIWVR